MTELQRNNNRNKIILDLCGGTGAWSRPYQEAGYDVRIITLPEQDVRYYRPPTLKIYGILAAPPCTDFAVSGASWWKTKDKEKGLLEGLSIVAACLRIIQDKKPKFWALENPVGRLSRFIGKPQYIFQPWEYGDPWTKRTCIWGEHNKPVKFEVIPVGSWTGSDNAGGKLGIVDHPEMLIHRHRVGSPDKAQILNERFPELKGKGLTRTELRSITPPGFAKAFFEANQ